MEVYKNGSPYVDYIAHRIKGDVEGNVRQVLAISRQLYFEENIVPLIPYVSLLRYLDENSSMERVLGMAANERIARMGAIRLQIHGPELSTGLRAEADLFKKWGRQIILRNPKLKRSLKRHLKDYSFETVPFELDEKYLLKVDELNGSELHTRFP
ncbi:hypothetical protein GOV11_03590 [Candidatus Woesearchaeota archaeon]|nr:hypothetical protein [Candidatus Woesearchaeota archaeon]